MPEMKTSNWRNAGKWVLRWIVIPPLIFIAAGLLLIAVLIARDCRVARVVLAGNLPDSMPVTLLARHSGGVVAEGKTILWRGPLGEGPILIPFAIPNTGHFEVKVQDPAGSIRSKEFGYISAMGDTHYIFIGRKNIIHGDAQVDMLRDLNGEISTVRQYLGLISTLLPDLLSCADRHLWDAFAGRSIR